MSAWYRDRCYYQSILLRRWVFDPVVCSAWEKKPFFWEDHCLTCENIQLFRGGVGLSKRPTIEGLDKRKSWSLDISSAASSRTNTASLKNVAESVSSATSKTAGSSSSRLSSYQNTDGLVGIGSRDRTGQGSPDPRNLKKKPVPLPRSKVPVAEQQPQAPVKKQTEKLFQRARTDLGCDALSFYKAKKMSQGSAGIKYPAPKVPAFSKPVPQVRANEIFRFLLKFNHEQLGCWLLIIKQYINSWN